jgi:hypothetical protein
MIQFDDLYCRKVRKMINADGIVFAVPVRRSLGRTMPRWKDNITNDVTEMAWERVD